MQAAAPPADHLPAPHTRQVEEPGEGAYCPGGLRYTLTTTGAGSVGCLDGAQRPPHKPQQASKRGRSQAGATMQAAATHQMSQESAPWVALKEPCGLQAHVQQSAALGQRSSKPQASKSPHICIFLARRRAARRLHAVPSWHPGPCRAAERRGLTTACTSWLARRQRTRRAAPPCS